MVPIVLGLTEIFVFNHVKSDREQRDIREQLIASMRHKRLPKNIFLCSTRRRKGTEGGAGKEGEKQGNKKGRGRVGGDEGGGGEEEEEE